MDARPDNRLARPAALRLLCAVCAAGILAVALFAAQARVDDVDAYLFAFYAKRMLAGDRLYADLWDNKPPGIFWADALGLMLSGGRYLGVVIACTAAALTTCTAFFLTARRLFSSTAAWLALPIACLYIFLYEYHVGSNRPSTLYVPLEILTVWAYLRHLQTRPDDDAPAGRRWIILAGIFAAAAVMCRQTAFAAPAAVCCHQLWLALRKRQPARRSCRTIALLAAGTAVGLALAAAALLITSDPAYAWHAIVTSNLGYFARPGKSTLLPELFRWHEHLQTLALPLVLATAAACYHAFISSTDDRPTPSIDGNVRRSATTMTPHPSSEHRLPAPPSTPPPSPGPVPPIPERFAFLVLWFACALYLALIGPSKRMMYFGIALPPLSLLAALGIHLLLRERAAASPTRVRRFSTVVAVVWIAYMITPALRHQLHAAQSAWFFRFDDRATPRYELPVQAILKYTQPTDPIYMWDYLPAVYFYADRPQAQRYIVATLIDQWAGRAQPYVDQIIADLKADPPKAIVLDRRALTTLEDPPPDHPIDYGRFADWLRANYRVPPDSPSPNVWIRNNAPK